MGMGLLINFHCNEKITRHWTCRTVMSLEKKKTLAIVG